LYLKSWGRIDRHKILEQNKFLENDVFLK
jgi:hypothetical protein